MAWFHNPDGDKAGRTKGRLVRAKAGVVSIPVYGRAYPEASAYPAGIIPAAITPLQYSIAAGQLYVATAKVKADRYVASNFGYAPSAIEDVVVEGKDEYYVIFFNHRLGFVKATDVEAVDEP